MIHVDVRSRHRKPGRPADKSAPQYLQWLRGRPCACAGRNPNCSGKIEAAHGPHKASKGMSSKCADRWAMPLSSACHGLQHRIGWQSFAAMHLHGDPLEICNAYWMKWPGRVAWERKTHG